MWRLLLANLRRKRLRLSLTIASIAVAFILFALIEALQHALIGGVDLAGQDRLMTMSKVSFIQPMPRAYLERVRATDGVRMAVSFNWFGGYYKDEHTQVFSYAVLGEDDMTNVYPQIHVDSNAWKDWLADRRGALVGQALATTMKWKVGDTIPLRSQIYYRKDGSNTWDMKIAGIFTNDDGDTNGLYFHYDYFNEGLRYGADNIGWITLRLKDARQAQQVAARVDSMFANSSAETKTSTEKAFIQGFANQMGNIASIVTVIVSAVFFTLLLVTANTMGQAVRERTSEIGVMKTFGFSSIQVTLLVLSESILITLIGGIAGLSLGALFVKGIAKAIKQFLPLMAVPSSAYVVGFACMILLGVLAGILPCWQAWQLKITDALRRA